MIMVCCSMAELFIQYKVIWFAFKSLYQQACVGLHYVLQKRGKNIAYLEKHAAKEQNKDVVEDFAKPEDLVKDWMWIVGLIVTVIIAIIICQLQWVSCSSPSRSFRGQLTNLSK